eukprot:147774_1
MAFFLFIFGILGMQLFEGKLRQRCFNPSTESWNLAHHCSMQVEKGGRACIAPEVCQIYVSNPLSDVVSFDNILNSWLIIIIMTSLEGWVDVMYMMDEAYTKWADIYFIALIVIGAMFVINLVVSVIFVKFKQSQADDRSMQQDKLRMGLSLFKPREDDVSHIDSERAREVGDPPYSWRTVVKIAKRKSPEPVVNHRDSLMDDSGTLSESEEEEHEHGQQEEEETEKQEVVKEKVENTNLLSARSANVLRQIRSQPNSARLAQSSELKQHDPSTHSLAVSPRSRSARSLSPRAHDGGSPQSAEVAVSPGGRNTGGD